MRTPRRLQRKRTRGWTRPAGAVYVGRPTRYGNPFPVAEFGVLALERFRAHALARLDADPAWLLPLRGKDLLCWCRAGTHCHADILIELANKPQP